MNTKLLIILLILILITIFTPFCSEYTTDSTPKIEQIDNPKVQESVVKNIAPIIKSQERYEELRNMYNNNIKDESSKIT